MAPKCPVSKITSYHCRLLVRQHRELVCRLAVISQNSGSLIPSNQLSLTCITDGMLDGPITYLGGYMETGTDVIVAT